MRHRLVVAIAVLAALALFGLVSVVLLVQDGNEPAGRVESATVDVALGDGVESPTSSDDGQASCVGGGTPPGSLALRLDVTLVDLSPDPAVEYALETELDGRLSDSVGLVPDDDRMRVREHLVTGDDGPLAVGDETTVTVSLLADGQPLDAVDRTTTVRAGTFRCVDDGT